MSHPILLGFNSTHFSGVQRHLAH